MPTYCKEKERLSSIVFVIIKASISGFSNLLQDAPHFFVFFIRHFFGLCLCGGNRRHNTSVRGRHAYNLPVPTGLDSWARCSLLLYFVLPRFAICCSEIRAVFYALD
ncbi:hypothetical protein SETIT_5G398700v2 [Setaria italica]|uniref:Uncharacterized protein n=2 Tax=Setaria TaxID=4554 RepID=A0A368RFJ3_SETIT|nr:hypothetical protein SETIT_5G398700v2 [Setaria italica]TKW17977.1 hypothetical protein SEVIR_5G404000v2 [Setaria viridis]